ncbi:MAG: efflux RND transporter permease subunit [Verrucomicrobiae bacterium]|nr:efflux RND transporter permease subunit [Verrucomicrobiae bacterium]
MTLAEISIRRPVFAWMLMSALIIFGAICFNRLGVSLLPDVEIPTITVTIDWPGAAPEVVETEIVDRVEQALVSVSGIRNINSTMRQGQAQLILELNVGRNVDAAMLEVQSNLNRIVLPQDVEKPQILKINPSDQEIIWMGLTSDTRSLRDLTVYAERYLRDQFQILPGVGQIVMSGFAERNLRVWVDPEKLKAYELTILDVQNALRTQHIEQAAGAIENSDREITIRMMGEGLSPEAVGEILIAQRGGQPIFNPSIKIRDVARVEDGLNDLRSISKIDGRRGAGIGIRKQRGANSVEVARVVRERKAEIEKNLPKDIQLQLNYDESVFTTEAVHETTFTLILSAILTALVCWLFLGSLSSTFNVVMSIPTSVLGTFMIMYFCGFTLNLFSLLALSLSIGIVVDDAIMVLENIVRHYEMGKDRMQAALDGAREITFAAVAATLAVIAVFLPIGLVEGVVGKFLFEFGITLCAAVALSLVEAITLTPMRCSQFLSIQRNNAMTRGMDSLMTRLSSAYGVSLVFCLRHRILIVAALTLFFIGSMFLAQFIPGEQSPAQDQSTIMVKFETPIGSSLESTAKKLEEFEKYVMARPEVNTYFLAVGSFMNGTVNSGISFVSLKPRSERKLSQQQLIEIFRRDLAKIEGLKSLLIDLSKGGPDGGLGFPINFSMQGPSLEVLKEQMDKLIKQGTDEKIIVDADTNFKTGQPELRIFIDRDKASARGVTVEAVSQSIQAAFGGIKMGKFTNEDRRYDVRIRLEPSQRLKVDDLRKLTVRNLHGELLPIMDVITFEEVNTSQVIARRNRERSITLDANPHPGVADNVAIARLEAIARENLPEGYRLIPSDASQRNKEFFQQVSFALILGVVVAYMVLASQFNSYGHPFIILLAMPFALSGAFIGLLVFGQTLNLFSFIGLVLLMGIVKKNSILLVEFTNQWREREGATVRESLLKACPIRLRPILMTSTATICAAIPPALALGPGAESRVPMAITIICGTFVSTVGTLFIVPCVYSLFEDLKAWGRPPDLGSNPHRLVPDAPTDQIRV